MKIFLFASVLLATGCASTGTRQPSSAQPAGQKFTCTQYKPGGHAPLLRVWVDGDKATLQYDRSPKIAHYQLEVDSSNDPGKPIASGRASFYRFTRVTKETPSNYDPDGLEVDQRMRDGSWEKNVISNSAGHAVFPALHFAVVDGHDAQSDDLGDDTHGWDCDPNDQVPSY